MNADIVLLEEIRAFFSADQAGPWAVAAESPIRAALPHLASSPAAATEGFPEALMLLRDTLDQFDPANPEAVAFELYDHLSDVLDFILDRD